LLYVIDTNNWGAYLSTRKKLPVEERLRTIPSNDIAVTEIQAGELWARAYNASTHRDLKLNQTRMMLQRIRTLRLSEQSAEIYGQLYANLKQSGYTLPDNDLWIAAILLEHHRSGESIRLVSTDRDFDLIPDIVRENWLA